MSKLQLVTKAIITTLGLYAVFSLLTPVKYLVNLDGKAGHDVMRIVITAFLFGVTSAVAFYVLVLNNNWLVRIIAPKQDCLSLAQQRRTYVTWQRLLFVFYGLLLLRGIFKTFKYMSYLSPAKIRTFVQSTIDGSVTSFADIFTPISIQIFSSVLLVGFTAYLIFGAPQLIKWNVKRLPSINDKSDLSGGNDNE